MNLGIYFGPSDDVLEAHLRPQGDTPDTPSPADVPPQVEEPLPIDLVYPIERREGND